MERVGVRRGVSISHGNSSLETHIVGSATTRCGRFHLQLDLPATMDTSMLKFKTSMFKGKTPVERVSHTCYHGDCRTCA